MSGDVEYLRAMWVRIASRKITVSGHLVNVCTCCWCIHLTGTRVPSRVSPDCHQSVNSYMLLMHSLDCHYGMKVKKWSGQDPGYNSFQHKKVKMNFPRSISTVTYSEVAHFDLNSKFLRFMYNLCRNLSLTCCTNSTPWVLISVFALS